ncbi:hypothetical protein D3C81_1069060 [compost metagenome]
MVCRDQPAGAVHQVAVQGRGVVARRAEQRLDVLQRDIHRYHAAKARLHIDRHAQRGAQLGAFELAIRRRPAQLLARITVGQEVAVVGHAREALQQRGRLVGRHRGVGHEEAVAGNERDRVANLVHAHGQPQHVAQLACGEEVGAQVVHAALEAGQAGQGLR